MSQLLIDRIGRCIQLLVSTDTTLCHEFPSQFGLAFFIREKHQNIKKQTESRAGFYRGFHTREQNHVTAGANPFLGSSFAAAAVGAVDMISKLMVNLVKESGDVHTN